MLLYNDFEIFQLAQTYPGFLKYVLKTKLRQQIYNKSKNLIDKRDRSLMAQEKYFYPQIYILK